MSAADYLTLAMRDAGRIEVRHSDGKRWHSGVFDDLLALRRRVDLLSGRGNVYTTINAPKIGHASNAMGDAALCDDDIAFVVRLPIDFDPVRPKNCPSTDDELREAVEARDAFVSAMLSLGWPMPATGLSGNGTHALYRCRLRATPELATQLRTLYRGWREQFSRDTAVFDSTVHNPARIWRLYGTNNRKGTPTPERPYRLASVTIPARWDAVSPEQIARLASTYEGRARRATPQAEHQGRRSAVTGAGDFSTLDVVAWFAAHTAYRRRIGAGKHAVTCPWSATHSTETDARGTDTVVWEADAGRWPTFHCSHAHCDGRDLRAVLDVWGDADSFCGSEWRRSRP